MTRKAEIRRNAKRDGMILLLSVVAIASTPQWQAIKDSRTYHDLMNITAFSKVTTETIAEPDGIVAFGYMQKDRCKFSGLVGYITLDNGRRIRFPVDTSVEDAFGVSGNRPVSGLLEAWGPWKIWYSMALGSATSWEIYAQHVPLNPDDKNCYQNNLFASGEWTTTQP